MATLFYHLQICGNKFLVYHSLKSDIQIVQKCQIKTIFYNFGHHENFSFSIFGSLWTYTMSLTEFIFEGSLTPFYCRGHSDDRKMSAILLGVLGSCIDFLIFCMLRIQGLKTSDKSRIQWLKSDVFTNHKKYPYSDIWKKLQNIQKSLNFCDDNVNWIENMMIWSALWPLQILQDSLNQDFTKWNHLK